MTKIEWTEATWSPVTGCTKVSSGCAHCYAERMAKRLRGRFGYPQDDPFRVTVHKDKIHKPLHWRKPLTVFVCSMGDLLHENVPEATILRVFDVMSLAEQHTFQILTKRPERLLQLHGNVGRWYLDGVHCLPNVWFGTSCENQETADERIPYLLKCPATVRFLSCEPLLSSLDLQPLLHFGDTLWDQNLVEHLHSETSSTAGQHDGQRRQNISSGRECGIGVETRTTNDMRGTEGEASKSVNDGMISQPSDPTLDNDRRQIIRSNVLTTTETTNRQTAVGASAGNKPRINRIPSSSRPLAGNSASATGSAKPESTDARSSEESVAENLPNPLYPAEHITASTDNRINWVIVGCESGPGARPMDLDWVRSIRDQCRAAGVLLFVKQLRLEGKLVKDMAEFPSDLQIRESPNAIRNR